MLSVFDLDFHCFDTKNTPSNKVAHLESSFKLWSGQWKKTFSDLKVNKKINSDDFLNRVLGGLFLKDKAIGFLLYNSFYVDRNSNLSHSYFENYNEEILSYLNDKSFKKIMVISYMTLDPRWRKLQTNLPISELLTSFCAKYFLESDCSALVGYFRTDRKTNEMFYRHGGESIIKNIKRYNVPVDFAYLTKDKVKKTPFKETADFADYLWDEYKEKSNARIHGLPYESNSRETAI